MRIVVDIECNKLKDPDIIWLIVCKDMDTGEYHVFRNVSQDPTEFLEFCPKVTHWVGHNLIGYDLPILANLIDFNLDAAVTNTIDTLILSKLVDYSRDGHSIEDYGIEFQFPKGTFSDWSRYSLEMEEYCKRDVDICHLIYKKYNKVITDKKWKKSLDLENRFELVCGEMHDNGFAFNVDKAQRLLAVVEGELKTLDASITSAFPPRPRLVREITPRLTKYGTLNRNDFRWVADGDLSGFNGHPFCLLRWEVFNPSSHKQIVDVLNAAGWKPTDKTKTHVEYLRDRKRNPADKARHDQYGWKVNEENISSLPAKAPAPARTLAKRILYEARRRTLVEWLNLVDQYDGRIHGEFHGIGTWTHRTATTKPNTQNIPNEKDDQGRTKLLGGELRALWCAPRNRLLVGCDAEGIQLRVFAHYINDPEFTKEVCDGDPHSLNRRILGSICKDRQASKRFIYALLLGAGIGKLASILECSMDEAKSGLSRILDRYTGFAELKLQVFPRDIRRGWFEGLDGRKVRIPSVGDRPHLVMSGYLQNGEAVIMKHATLEWKRVLDAEGIEYKLVDLVHDEWQTECANDWYIAKRIAQAQCDALKQTGIDLGLNVPLAGSYKNKKGVETIGNNWRVTH